MLAAVAAQSEATILYLARPEAQDCQAIQAA